MRRPKQISNPPVVPMQLTECPLKAKVVDAIIRKLDNAELEESPPDTDIDGVYWKRKKRTKKKK